MSSRRPSFRAVAAGALLLALLAGLVACNAADPRPAERAELPDPRPNIVFILTDDQSVHTYRRELMPNTFSRIADEGVQFREAIAAPPLCCPYRAGFLTGQYPRNHGVLFNEPGYASLRDKDEVLPVWLRQADYTTALIGKYLNGYRGARGAEVAPGWDEWFQIELRAGFARPNVDIAGDLVKTPGYTTDVLTEEANEFIAAQQDAADPFFLWLTHLAPHTEARPQPASACPPGYAQPRPQDLARYDGPSFAEVRRRSFNEASVGDKPGKAGERALLTREERAEIRLRFRCAAAAVERVDDGVGSVLDTLEQTGQLEDTIVIFGSDNGLFYGEHRDRKGKGAIFEEALNVPLAIRIPEGFAGADAAPGAAGGLIAQQDLTAAILEWADAAPCDGDGECRTLDGRSAIDLLERGDWGAPRAIPYDLYRSCPRHEEGVRTKRYAYVRPGEGPRCDRVDGEQLYDLRRDPFELRNVAEVPRYARIRRRLDRETARLTSCAGIRGRDRRAGEQPFCR